MNTFYQYPLPVPPSQANRPINPCPYSQQSSSINQPSHRVHITNPVFLQSPYYDASFSPVPAHTMQQQYHTHSNNQSSNHSSNRPSYSQSSPYSPMRNPSNNPSRSSEPYPSNPSVFPAAAFGSGYRPINHRNVSFTIPPQASNVPINHSIRPSIDQRPQADSHHSFYPAINADQPIDQASMIYSQMQSFHQPPAAIPSFAMLVNQQRLAAAGQNLSLMPPSSRPDWNLLPPIVQQHLIMQYHEQQQNLFPAPLPLSQQQDPTDPSLGQAAVVAAHHMIHRSRASQSDRPIYFPGFDADLSVDDEEEDDDDSMFAVGPHSARSGTGFGRAAAELLRRFRHLHPPYRLGSSAQADRDPYDTSRPAALQAIIDLKQEVIKLTRLKETAESKSPADDSEIPTCSICLSDFEDGEIATLMPCEHPHPFHKECLLPWLKKNNTCPSCRHEILTDDEFYNRLLLAKQAKERAERENRRNATETGASPVVPVSVSDAQASAAVQARAVAMPASQEINPPVGYDDNWSEYDSENMYSDEEYGSDMDDYDFQFEDRVLGAHARPQPLHYHIVPPYPFVPLNQQQMDHNLSGDEEAEDGELVEDDSDVEIIHVSGPRINNQQSPIVISEDDSVDQRSQPGGNSYVPPGNSEDLYVSEDEELDEEGEYDGSDEDEEGLESMDDYDEYHRAHHYH